MVRRIASRGFLGLVACALLGAGVEISGIDHRLSLEAVVPPAVPRAWAPGPTTGGVDVTLLPSLDLVSGIGKGLGGGTIALQERGALALVDGRVFAISVASARDVLRSLRWDGLPISARTATAADLDRFAAPAPAPLAWRARLALHLGLRAARGLAAAHPGFAVTTLAAWLLMWIHTALVGLPRPPSRDASETEATTWRRRRTERPVRVVLVPDLATLAQVRVAIGEEHVIAATEHAFAFADGWILAVRKGSVFELASELGWRLRPIEMATRGELAEEGHDLSPLAGDDPADTLGLLEALHVCGPIAHGTLTPRTAGAFSVA